METYLPMIKYSNNDLTIVRIIFFRWFHKPFINFEMPTKKSFGHLKI